VAWTRVRCEAFEGELELPPVCPNCLGTPAGARFTPAGDPAGPKYPVPLPLCEECAALLQRRRRLALMTGVLPGLGLAVIGFAAGCLEDSVNAGEVLMTVGFLACPVVMVAGHALAAAVIYFSPKTGGRVTNFSAVRFHFVGGDFVAKARFLDLEFLNEEYARMVIEANPQLDPDLARTKR
jgi:hypothetical protein